jgi:hypothetical protein
MPRLLVFIILNASPILYFSSILPHHTNFSYCFAPKYSGKIQTSSVILSTSPHASSLYIKRSKTITPSKLSHLAEKMAKTSQSNPDDGSRSVIPRSDQYQLLEKKRSIFATLPRVVTKEVRDKKSATTINDDVYSPLSTATLATTPAIPWMEWAQIKEELEPTLEDNEEEDNSINDGDRNDDGNVGRGSGGDCNSFAAAAAKSANDNDDYSDDDGNNGSGGGGISNNQKYDNISMGGGKCGPTGDGLYYPDDDTLLDDIFDDDYMEKHFLLIPDEPACD